MEGNKLFCPILEVSLFPQADLMDFTDQAAGDIPTTPRLRVTRPSQTSSTDSESINAAVDEDFTRLAKARSNPNILRSTLEHSDITGEVPSWLVNSPCHVLTCIVSVTGFKLYSWYIWVPVLGIWVVGLNCLIDFCIVSEPIRRIFVDAFTSC